MRMIKTPRHLKKSYVFYKCLPRGGIYFNSYSISGRSLPPGFSGSEGISGSEGTTVSLVDDETICFNTCCL